MIATPEELVAAARRNLKQQGPLMPSEPPASANQWPSPLSADAFYGLAGEIVRTIEPHSEADPAALLTQLLVAIGNLVGRNTYFQVEGGRHYPNEYLVLVGQTAKGRKGTSMAQIIRLVRLVRPDYTENRIVDGLSSGEGLIWSVRDKIIQRQPVKQKGRVVDYEDVEIDPGVEDKRVLVMEGEFAQVLKVAQREGNTLSPVLRRAWDDGRKLQSLTKSSPAKATDAHISIIAHITAEELRHGMSATESANGFANRFLWVCVRRSKCLPEGGRIHEVDFSEIVKKLEAAIAFGQNPDYLVARDSEAKELWSSVYPDLSEGGRGLLGAVTTRAEAHVMRLAMIYAILDCSPWIKLAHLRAALAVWKYCAASCQYIFGTATGNRAADDLLSAIRNAPDGLTRRQINVEVFGRNRTSEQISNALKVLCDVNHIRCEIRETGGRPEERWYAVGGYE